MTAPNDRTLKNKIKEGLLGFGLFDEVEGAKPFGWERSKSAKVISTHGLSLAAAERRNFRNSSARTALQASWSTDANPLAGRISKSRPKPLPTDPVPPGIPVYSRMPC